MTPACPDRSFWCTRSSDQELAPRLPFGLPSIDLSARNCARTRQIHKFVWHVQGHLVVIRLPWRGRIDKGRYFKAPTDQSRGALSQALSSDDRSNPMIFKRGQTYWYRFNWSIKQAKGRSKSFLIRRSARTKAPTEAEEVEREHRRALRLGEIHPLDPWPKPLEPEAPLLRDFSTRFLEYARLHVKESSFAFYSAAVCRLLAFPELANKQISKIKPEVIARFAGARKAEGVGVSAINGDLRTLRRILRGGLRVGPSPETARCPRAAMRTNKRSSNLVRR